MANIYEKYFNKEKKRIAVLLDPDKHTAESASIIAEKIEKSPADIILVGGSMVNNSVPDIVDAVKKQTSKPVVLFPGGGAQVCAQADALLLLSLISGRNPEYLIGEHVRSAMHIHNIGIETISTGYILIDGGIPTSVQYVSNTMPIPSGKTDLVVSTAIAGEMIGMRNIYLEAGSGAIRPVEHDTIHAVSEVSSLPIMVGGGLKSMSAIEKAFIAGADIAVVGTAIEKNPDFFKR
jgi:putative glycerol-1-phosphate prenyltransferase